MERDFPGLTTSIEDVSWALKWTTTWTALELNIAVICGCLTQLRPLFKCSIPSPTHQTTSNFSSVKDPALKTLDRVRLRSRTLGDAEEGGLRRDDPFVELNCSGEESATDEWDMDVRESVGHEKTISEHWGVTVQQDWEASSHHSVLTAGTNEWRVSAAGTSG
jgi:hypothetical protein